MKKPAEAGLIEASSNHQLESSFEDDEDEELSEEPLPESHEDEELSEEDEEEDPESQEEDELSDEPPPKSKLEESRVGAAGAL
jgi:hypothetical protein